MGKYMKKTKSAVAMDLSSTAATAESSGVRTRAKTLALQKLQQQRSPSPTKIVPVAADESSLSYLQLRSRRLEKPPLRKEEDSDEISRGSRRGLKCKAPSSRLARVSSDAGREGDVFGGTSVGEGSFGQNYCSEFEPRDSYALNISRSTRESTPCSLMKCSDDSAGTSRQGSSSMAAANNRRVRNEDYLPTVQEMDDFFARAEERQQRLFIEKYNYDVVNDMPLPGRYEWIEITP
ncbi:Cyclin-dependent kinase inhibitor 3 [Linum grandiflorum]